MLNHRSCLLALILLLSAPIGSPGFLTSTAGKQATTQNLQVFNLLRPFSLFSYKLAIKHDDADDEIDHHQESLLPPLVIHHSALKTRNITTAIQFYSLLGYSVSCRFRAGPARAAWLELDANDDADADQPRSSSTRTTTSSSTNTRLELIEVPSYMLNDDEARAGTARRRRRAPDLMEQQDILGYNHVALDVTRQIQRSQDITSLSDWIEQLNATSLHRFGKKLRVALEPRQQIIGRSVYELGFLYDADGCLVELLHHQSDLEQEIASGWDPWDGKGFVG